MVETWYFHDEVDAQKEILESYCNRVDGEFDGGKTRTDFAALSGAECKTDDGRIAISNDGEIATKVSFDDNQAIEHRSDLKKMRIRPPYVQIHTDDGSQTITMNVDAANDPIF